MTVPFNGAVASRGRGNRLELGTSESVATVYVHPTSFYQRFAVYLIQCIVNASLGRSSSTLQLDGYPRSLDRSPDVGFDKARSEGTIAIEQIRVREKSSVFQQFKKYFLHSLEAANFLRSLERVVGMASRILALSLVVVIFVTAIQLGISIVAELLAPPYGQFETDLFKIFGLILDVLIAIELQENVTIYLKRNVFQVELVIVTALIAVARKIIILDFSATPGLKLIGLGLAIVALAASYWLVKQPNSEDPRQS